LIHLYGEETLSIHRPNFVDEGFDLIFKKGSQQIIFVRVKSRFGSDANECLLLQQKPFQKLSNSTWQWSSPILIWEGVL
jgi:Holliday junction resolvase-like predicted endonuclease